LFVALLMSFIDASCSHIDLGRLSLNPVVFAGPGVEVKIFAAFAAKGSAGIAAGVSAWPLAARAFHDAWGERWDCLWL
jgi:hypothetical protein